MKKITLAVLSVLALSSSVAFAEGGGDRVHERSAQNMKVAMDAYKAKHEQLATSAQVEASKVQK